MWVVIADADGTTKAQRISAPRMDKCSRLTNFFLEAADLRAKRLPGWVSLEAGSARPSYFVQPKQLQPFTATPTAPPSVLNAAQSFLFPNACSRLPLVTVNATTEAVFGTLQLLVPVNSARFLDRWLLSSCPIVSMPAIPTACLERRQPSIAFNA